jgi:hypothetical protein
MTRGSPAVVIVPTAAAPTVVFGAPNGGVFVRLRSRRGPRARSLPAARRRNCGLVAFVVAKKFRAFSASCWKNSGQKRRRAPVCAESAQLDSNTVSPEARLVALSGLPSCSRADRGIPILPGSLECVELESFGETSADPVRLSETGGIRTKAQIWTLAGQTKRTFGAGRIRRSCYAILTLSARGPFGP